MYTPVNPSFTIQKWGLMGSKLYRYVFVMQYFNRRTMADNSYNDYEALVIDPGSDTCKVGFAVDATPRAVFPSVRGLSRYKGCIYHTSPAYRIDCVGHEAQSKRDTLDLKYPIEKGIINNWDDFEMILHHGFCNELHVDPADYIILMTECPYNPKENREKMTQTMFETFNTASLNLANQSVLPLYAAGLTTGIVIDSGEGVTHIVPVTDGYAISKASNQLEVAGKNLTNFLSIILKDNVEHVLNTDNERDIKEKLPASVAQLDASSDWRPGGRGFNPRRGRQHSFVEIDHEIFSTVILSLPLTQEGQLSVSGERMCTILVNRLEH